MEEIVLIPRGCFFIYWIFRNDVYLGKFNFDELMGCCSSVMCVVGLDLGDGGI